jgi:soluble lytic murein transglycosylase-like protein
MTEITHTISKTIIGMGTNMLRVSLSMAASFKQIDHILTYYNRVLMSTIALALAPVSTATASQTSVPGDIPFEECFFEAGSRYSIEPSLLMALAHTESRFNADALNKRSESDWDIGVMQIWSNWLPKLEKYNIQKADLLDPCININIGAWILAQNFASHGMNLLALGAYNAGFSDKNEAVRTAYVEKVIPKLHHYRNIINARRSNARNQRN